MAENRAVTDGDVFILKLNTGMLQAIESHRICTPPNLIDDPSWVNGVKIDSFGRPTDYAVCGHDRKNPNDYTFIPAQFVFELGYFERFDQVRGVSPLAAALNQFSDLYECREYALAKAKIASILGLKLTREYVEENADEESADPLTINLANGPTVIELEPGQDADILESQTPSTQFVEYTKVVTADALKCLDIPYSFFDEAHTNYSGARQALLQYEQSAAIRRGIIERLLTNLTLWRLGLFIQDRTLQLPAGMTISDINFEWIGTALPWISPKDEALAEISLIDNAMDCRQDLCKKHGKDWFNIVDKLAQENKYLEANGVTTAAARAAMFQTPAPESPEEN
jgi:capsid protein